MEKSHRIIKAAVLLVWLFLPVFFYIVAKSDTWLDPTAYYPFSKWIALLSAMVYFAETTSELILLFAAMIALWLLHGTLFLLCGRYRWAAYAANALLLADALFNLIAGFQVVALVLDLLIVAAVTTAEHARRDECRRRMA